MDNTSLFFLTFRLNGQNPVLDQIMIFGTEYLIYLTFLLMFVLVLRGGSKERKAFLLVLLSLPIAVLMIKGIHLFFFEPRPFVEFNLSPLTNTKADASFPSRHSTIMAVMAFSYLFSQSRWAILFLLFMLFVGLSRIYVGVHYPLDIIGGFAAGIIALVIARQIVNSINLRFFR